MAACGCGFKRDGSGRRTKVCAKHKNVRPARDRAKKNKK